jgi:hypothetical protein
MEEAGQWLVTIFGNKEKVKQRPEDMKHLKTNFRDTLGILQGQYDMTCDSHPGTVDLGQTLAKYVSVLPPPLVLQLPSKQPWEYKSVF